MRGFFRLITCQNTMIVNWWLVHKLFYVIKQINPAHTEFLFEEAESPIDSKFCMTSDHKIKNQCCMKSIEDHLQHATGNMPVYNYSCFGHCSCLHGGRHPPHWDHRCRRNVAAGWCQCWQLCWHSLPHDEVIMLRVSDLTTSTKGGTASGYHKVHKSGLQWIIRVHHFWKMIIIFNLMISIILLEAISTGFGLIYAHPQIHLHWTAFIAFHQ